MSVARQRVPATGATGGFIAVLEVELHFPEAHDLKARRKHVKSMKDLIQSRFGAAVAETGFQDKWQRAELTVAMVSNSHHHLVGRVDELSRWLDERMPAGVSLRRSVLSIEELG